MEDDKLKGVLEQQFAVLKAEISEGNAKRDMVFSEKLNDVERRTDRIHTAADEALKQTGVIFEYIDGFRTFGPKIDILVEKVDKLADMIKDHDERLRNVEMKGQECKSHEKETEDHEKRLRKVEEAMNIITGSGKTWVLVMLASGVIISLAALVVSIFK